MYIIIAILIFGVLIAVHELGHFLAAKLFGVRVNEFSIGMGPAVWQRKKGETAYSLRLLPIGGFCAMEGEDEGSDDPRALNNKGLFPRFIIFAAGAFMNFLTGFLILVWLCSNLAFVYTPVITGFADGFEAQGENGLTAGDRIISIDGERVLLYEDVSIFLNLGNGETYDFVVERDGRHITLTDLPLAPKEYPNEDGTSSVRFGLNFGEIVEATPLVKLKMAGLHSADFVRLVWYSLEMLVTGQVGLSDMSGPVGIVTTISDVGQGSTSLFMAAANIGYLTALIAINLAVMNLLPIPGLDGGRILFLAVDAVSLAVFRRKVPEKYQAAINMAGMVVLLGFMLLITVKDVFQVFQ